MLAAHVDGCTVPAAIPFLAILKCVAAPLAAATRLHTHTLHQQQCYCSSGAAPVPCMVLLAGPCAPVVRGSVSRSPGTHSAACNAHDLCYMASGAPGWGLSKTVRSNGASGLLSQMTYPPSPHGPLLPSPTRRTQAEALHSKLWQAHRPTC